MDLKHLTDECLLAETENLAKQEREILSDVLHHLREMERRRMYGGKSSLFAYAMEKMKYSKDQAHRRIAAMRLLTEMPQLEDKIQDGAINLTHVGMAHTLFQDELAGGAPMTTEQKLEVFEAMAGRTTRQAQGAINKFATQPVRTQEIVKGLGEGRNMVTMELSDQTLAHLEQIKGWLAHQDPQLNLGGLVSRLTELGLQHLNPVREPKKEMSPHTKAAIRRKIWARDGGACVTCKSRFALEEDHILPKSMGGEYTFENIRLLCRSCNQRAAIEKLGQEKMDQYLKNAFG